MHYLQGRFLCFVFFCWKNLFLRVDSQPVAGGGGGRGVSMRRVQRYFPNLSTCLLQHGSPCIIWRGSLRFAFFCWKICFCMWICKRLWGGVSMRCVQRCYPNLRTCLLQHESSCIICREGPCVSSSPFGKSVLACGFATGCGGGISESVGSRAVQSYSG